MTDDVTPEPEAVARAREFCEFYRARGTSSSAMAKDVVAPLLAEYDRLAAPPPADPGSALVAARVEAGRQLDSVRCSLAEMEELAGRLAVVIDQLSRAIRSAEGAIRGADLRNEEARP